jgi:hypothetical protein
MKYIYFVWNLYEVYIYIFGTYMYEVYYLELI